MLVLDIIRYSVLGIFAAGGALAVGSWAVTTRRLNPFSRTAQLIRAASDPLLDPIERWRLRRGGNPQNAPWWLLGIITVGGIAIIVGSQWVVLTLQRAGGAVAAGPRGILRLSIYYAGQIVIIALIARVIGTWVGVGRFNRWMRVAYVLTDWIVEPLRRVIPSFGPFDISPVVAWILLQFALGIVLRLI